MTECERIIEQGILPKSFFEPETICDFYVDENRKKVWAVELDLLLEFDRVCKKHGLRYYLFFGTLLGAVRHKGFIPWDDDIDIAMPRDDYNKLIKIANEFHPPYFLQTPDTDPHFIQTIIKLRNIKTTAFNSITSYEGFNNGMFIDLFILDNFLPECAKERFEEIKKLAIDLGTYSRLHNPDPSEKDKKRIDNYLRRNVNPYEIYEQIQSIASQYNNASSDWITCAVYTRYELGKLIWQSKCFEKTINVEFEGYYFPVPEGYDAVLKVLYGDYMTIPIIEDRHGNYCFAPDIPFIEYEKSMRFRKEVL